MIIFFFPLWSFGVAILLLIAWQFRLACACMCLAILFYILCFLGMGLAMRLTNKDVDQVEIVKQPKIQEQQIIERQIEKAKQAENRANEDASWNMPPKYAIDSTKTNPRYESIDAQAETLYNSTWDHLFHLYLQNGNRDEITRCITIMNNCQKTIETIQQQAKRNEEITIRANERAFITSRYRPKSR